MNANVEMKTNVKKDIIVNDEVIRNYMNPGEKITGFGLGGSESLTIFLIKPGEDTITVRKILSEKLITASWCREGRNVMLPPYKKAKQQAYYLKDLPDSAKPFFPIVGEIIERTIEVESGNSVPPNKGEAKKGTYNELIYEMSFIEGDEVSEFVRKHQPSVDIIARLYVVIFQTLNDVIHKNKVRKPSGPTLELSYFQKIEDRLELSRKTSPNVFSNDLLNTDYIYIDGIKHLNVKPLLRKFRSSKNFLRILEPLRHTLVMGDTNTENIKITKPDVLLDYMKNNRLDFTAKDIGIKFLDPRAIGFHEDGVDSGSDDPMYDNKPWHNSLGRYDLIHSEYFDLDVRKNHDGMSIEVKPHVNHSYARSYNNIESYFKSVMYEAWDLENPDSDIVKNDPYWMIRFAFVMGTHFTAMPPFHFHKNEQDILIDDYKNQRRPVAIYVEGIKWLNVALNMLEGNVANFYGVPVAFDSFGEVV